MDPENHSGEPEISRQEGSPPRRRFAFFLVVGAFAVLLVAALVLLLSPAANREGTKTEEQKGSPGANVAASSTAPSQQGPAEGVADNGTAASQPDSPVPPSPPAEVSSPAEEMQAAEQEATAPGASVPSYGEIAATPRALEIPPGTSDSDLKALPLPPLPYSIYVGAYRTLEEARTTQRELQSDYLPSYIVPVEVTGEVAQSLFGVTQDGSWYSVHVGEFASKEEARKTLNRMMNQRREVQPEIMQFPYALDCGRYLDEQAATNATDRLSNSGFFPYTQTFQIQDGRVLTRVLVGCHFSEKGTADQKSTLEKAGFSCRAEVR